MRIRVHIAFKPHVVLPVGLARQHIVAWDPSAGPLIAQPEPAPEGRRSWSQAELQLLRNLYPAGGVPAVRAVLPARSDRSIENKAARLSLKRLVAKRHDEPVLPAPSATPPRPSTASAPARPATAAPRKPVPPSWVEQQIAKLQAARNVLRGRGVSVTPNGRDPGTSGWWVSGFTAVLTSAEVIAYAEQLTAPTAPA